MLVPYLMLAMFTVESMTSSTIILLYCCLAYLDLDSTSCILARIYFARAALICSATTLLRYLLSSDARMFICPFK